MKLKNSIAYICLMLFVFSFTICAEISIAGELPLRSYYKTDYVNEDVVSKGLDPNVLFLLDTSTAMTFAPWGVMPNEDDGRNISDRAKLLKDSTFGHGMRPPIFDGVETTIISGGYGTGSTLSYNRYGRDLDSNNNVIGSADCYYTSDPTKPFLLTFRNRHLAHYDKWINSTGSLSAPTFGNSSNLPNSGVVGTLTSGDWIAAVNEANEAYTKLLPYIPTQYEKDESGDWVVASGYEKPPVPLDLANLYLVPNDSRLYSMKLALWRLTGEINSKVLLRMNVAAAITYQDIDTDLYAPSIATKSAKPGAGEKHRDYFGSTIDFPHGNAASYVTGVYGKTKDIDGVDVSDSYMSQSTKRGVWVDIYHNRKAGDNLWNALSRSILYVPFDKFYETGADGRVIKTAQLNNFRNYISGYEHYKGIYNPIGALLGAETEPVKDEFWASSLTLLSTAIYGGRDSSEGGNFPFHKGKKITDSNLMYRPTGENMIQFAVTPKNNAGSTNFTVILLNPSINTDNLPTGQAVGSVLDFFSPPPTDSNVGLDGVKFANDSVGFFPVTGSCQQNWLIVFCAGNDAVTGYPPADAVRRLFQKTRTMRGRRYDGARWVEENYEMDSGVRTIVVGFLPEEQTNEAPEIKKIRADLIAMAKAGDPILSPAGVYIDNPDAAPEIANDVPGLMKAFDNVLRRIQVEKMGSGTVSTLPVIDDITDPNSRVVFGAAYKINPLDQWNGWLGKYLVKENGSVEQWEANRGMISKGLDRALYTSVGRQGADALDVAKVDTGRLETLADIPRNHASRFSSWLLNYEHNTWATDSVGILGDMVNSGITVVGKPRHRSLVNSAINNRDAVVYVQTNRGVLHALNYMNGNEVWGFIPPNIFQYKLKNQKFDRNGLIDGNGFTRVRSNPMVLLDGMLIAKDVEYQNVVRTLLTGYLGHGGNGFYTMDITEMDSSVKPPVFRWAIENARYDDDTGSYSINERVKRWGEAAKTSISNYDYTDLGLTIVPGVYFTPVVGGADTIGVLPGGLGHKLGKGDTQGKAFYFFNPTNGSIIRKIDSSSNPSTGFDAPPGRNLGMGISPIIYHENAYREAIAFYTADSEGNVMQCNMERESLPFWKLKSIFQFRTLGDLFSYETGATVSPPTGDLAVAIPQKMLLARSRNNYTWLMGGTSNLFAPESVSDDLKMIINAEQFVFGLNTNNLLKSDELNIGITPSNGNVRKMPYYIDDIPDKYGKYGQPYDFDDQILGIKYGMDDYGWVLRLRPKFGVTEAEYLSAAPFLMNNILYVATFIPYAGSISEEACSDIGAGKIYALDPSTGRSIMPEKPAIVIENVKIVGISGNPANNRLILSVKELTGDAKNEISGSLGDATDIGNGLFEVGAPGGSPFDPGVVNPDFDFEELIPNIQYWSERF